MQRAVEKGGLGLTGTQVGTIRASLKLTYAIGQLINGQLSEKISPRILLAVGMLGSAALNVVFGLSAGFVSLLVIWAANGYFQSLGWTPCMRVVGNWVPVHRRGKAIGIIGTGYQVTAAVTFVVSGLAVRWLGWRYALFIPAAMLTATAIFMLVFLKEAPDEDSQAALGGQDSASHKERGSWAENLILTLSNPALWLLGLALALLNATRYGYLDWGIDHLTDMQDASISKNAIKYAVLPIGGVCGSYLAGLATDRWFGSRRAPVIVALMFLLGVLTLVYGRVAQVSEAGTLFLLVIIGFCIYGPQVLLVGTAPSDLARRGTSAAAAGFVNFVGYIGAAVGDMVTGYYKMPEHGGWQFTINIWAGWAFAASLLMALLWNVTGKKSDPSSD